MKKLNYKKMIEEVSALVETDFCFSMDSRFATSGKVKFTNDEAKEMAGLLGSIYSIAHCVHCGACNPKYRV